MNEILIGKGEQPVHLLAKYANRHGLIAGATGTGKTISLLVLAEGFSRMGVPVFIADVKGDVAGLSLAGAPNKEMQQRVAQIGIKDYIHEASPVVFWDLYGKAGHPVRTTVSEIGPTLLGRILELNDTQSGMLDIALNWRTTKPCCCLTSTTCAHSWDSSRTTARRSQSSTALSAHSPWLPFSAHS